MKEQIKVLTEQLLEAKRHHTPVSDRSNSTVSQVSYCILYSLQEMYHFMALQTKIASLEHK